MQMIGCDLHARQQTLAILDSETGVLEERVLEHTGDTVRDFYRSLKKPVRVGIEATGSMHWFLELMEELGIECQVGHPARIRACEPRKQKHDRRDAQLLLRLLSENRFPSIWMPSLEQRDVRSLLTYRHQWVRIRVRVQNALQSIALSHGLRRGRGMWSKAGLHAIGSLPLPPYATERRDALVRLYLQLQHEIADRKIARSWFFYHGVETSLQYTSIGEAHFCKTEMAHLTVTRGGIRLFFQQQQLYVFVAVAVFAAFSALRLDTHLWTVLVSSLCIGNSTVLIMTRFHRYYAGHRFPFNWLAFLPLLALVGFGSAVAATEFVYWLLPRSARVGVNTSENIRISTLITIIVGVTAYTYRNMKTKLETQNVTLQQEVQNSSARLEQQEKELEIAKEIQAGLIPKQIPQLRDVQIVASWRPARAVGGDYFDVIKLDERRMAICIADVVGKGIAAALLMANVQAAVKAFATPTISPSEMCTRLNQALCSNLAPGKFVTFFFCVVYPEARTLTYCNAGHCFPLLAHATGKLEACGQGGTVLGIFPDTKYEDGMVLLKPGDKLLLFTDGISEAMSPLGEEYGELRLRQKLVATESTDITVLHDELMKEVSDHCSGQFADDATFVLLSFMSSQRAAASSSFDLLN